MAVDVIIRPAGTADWPGLALLRWRWSVVERGETSALPKDSYIDHYVEWLGAHTASHQPFVAVAAGGSAPAGSGPVGSGSAGSGPVAVGEVVGMAWLCVVDRPPTPGRLGRRAGEIQSVFVLPELRNAGVGERLMRAVLDHARELRLAHLTVHAAPRAIPFYRRLGFGDHEQWLVIPDALQR